MSETTSISKQELKLIITLVYITGTNDGAKGDFDRVYLDRLMKAIEARES